MVEYNIPIQRRLEAKFQENKLTNTNKQKQAALTQSLPHNNN